VNRLRARRGDDGAILVITLAFLLLFGLFIGALLGQVGANFKTTGVVRSRDIKNLNADGGIEYGLLRAQQDPSRCASSAAGTQSLTDQLPGGLIINGSRAVSVTCTTISGESTGANGYAVIVTHATNGLTTSQGGSKTINGPVFLAGPSNPANLSVLSGDVTQRLTPPATCPSSASIGMAPDPPYAFRCTTAAVPDPAHALPPRPSANPNVTANTTVVPGCKVFTSGTFPSGTAPALSSKNYFASGVYVLKDVTWQIDTDVYAGKQATGEGVQLTSGAPCATDASAGVSDGTGALFVLEGTAKIVVRHGRFEVFSRQGASSGTQGLSLVALGSPAPAGWTAHAPQTTVLDADNGSNPELSMHGMVYAPTANVNLFTTSSSKAQLLGGVVAFDLDLGQASGAGTQVSTQVGIGKRVVVITATADGATPGEAKTRSDGLIEIGNDAARTLSVRSRRVY
jgi:hypothetical protein